MSRLSAATAELRQSASRELQERLVLLRKEQFNLRFQQAVGKLEKVSEFKRVRRDIARLETLLNEKKLGSKEPLTVVAVESRSRRHFNKVQSQARGSNLVQRSERDVAGDMGGFAADVLEETLAMLDDGPLDTAALIRRLGLKEDILSSPERLRGMQVSVSAARAARRATALLVPHLYAHSRSDIADILKLLSVTAYFETNLPADVRVKVGERLVELLRLYDVPCLISAEVTQGRSAKVLKLAATDDISNYLKLGGPFRIRVGDHPISVTVFVSAIGKAPSRIAEYVIDSSEGDWEQKLEIPATAESAFITVAGETTRFSLAG